MWFSYLLRSLHLYREVVSMIAGTAKVTYHLLGWKVKGLYAREEKHLILIVAPHTSNWDFPVGMLVRFWLKMDVFFYAKASLFKGLLGMLLRKLKGIPIDRSQNHNLVDQVVQDFKTRDRHHILITPEGTRKRTDRFKSGFYYIALKANVQIQPISFDFEHKLITFMPPRYVRGDGASEIEEIRNLFKGIRGKNPEWGILN